MIPTVTPQRRLPVLPAALWVYGTLTCVEVVEALLGRRPRAREARTVGWRVAPIRNRPYPGLVPGDEEVTGQLLEDLSPAEWSLLDRFEAPSYELARIRVTCPDRDGHHALGAGEVMVPWTYRYRGPDAGPGTWDREHFRRTGLTEYLLRTDRWLEDLRGAGRPGR